VNLKPLVPGHVLVCPRRPHRRLTDLAPPELADLFCAVQRVQRMLARQYFAAGPSAAAAAAAATTTTRDDDNGPGAHGAQRLLAGSFNVAVQDGPEAGQTVPHLHVHVIPRPGRPLAAEQQQQQTDVVYKGMASEAGNVGGALWDAQRAQRTSGPRPSPGGQFPDVEEATRRARSTDEMDAEADLFRGLLREMEREMDGH
jgi:bis(5'-adenosyl)-triphosphatase